MSLVTYVMTRKDDSKICELFRDGAHFGTLFMSLNDRYDSDNLGDMPHIVVYYEPLDSQVSVYAPKERVSRVVEKLGRLDARPF